MQPGIALAVGLAVLAVVAAPAPTNADAAPARLLASASALSAARAVAPSSSFATTQVVRTGTVWHVRLVPLVGGVPVQDSAWLLHLDNRFRVLDHGQRPPVAERLVGSFLISRTRALGLALQAAGAPVLRAPARARRVAAQGHLAAWEVLLPERPFRDVRVTVAADDGRVLSLRDVTLALDGQGLVFDPDPVSELGYAPPDGGDADSPALTEALRAVTLPVLDGSGRLAGPFAIATGGEPATSASEQFLYHRDDPRFEQVMAYYHVTLAGLRYRGLGFGTGAPVRIVADAGTADDSAFSAATRTISLGRGGVDDGEDAEVIVHEYGHALQAVVAPGFPSTAAGEPVAEGFADYVAADYAASRGMPASLQPCLFPWDASGMGASCERRLDAGLVYPTDLTGEPHHDGQIWSQALWTLRGEVGSDIADRLALASSAYLQPASGLVDAAAALQQADHDLYAGADESAIQAALAPRGLLRAPQTGPPSGTTARLTRAALHAHVLDAVISARGRVRVSLSLQTVAGRSLRRWRRRLPSGRSTLRLWAPGVLLGQRYRVVCIARRAAGGAPGAVTARLLHAR